MIIELTSLHVDRKSTEQFEAALTEALGVIRCAEGYVSHHAEQCADDPYRYFLTVQWKGREEAIDRFRESGRMKEIRYLLHGFYDELPQTNYYSELDLDFVAELSAKAHRAVVHEPRTVEPTC